MCKQKNSKEKRLTATLTSRNTKTPKAAVRPCVVDQDADLPCGKICNCNNPIDALIETLEKVAGKVEAIEKTQTLIVGTSADVNADDLAIYLLMEAMKKLANGNLQKIEKELNSSIKSYYEEALTQVKQKMGKKKVSPSTVDTVKARQFLSDFGKMLEDYNFELYDAVLDSLATKDLKFKIPVIGIRP